MRTIRVRVPAGLTEDIEVIVELEPESTGRHETAAGAQPNLDPGVAADLAQLARKASASPYLDRMAQELRQLEYRLVAMQTAGMPDYVRFVDPQYTAHGTGEIHPSWILFTRREQREPLAGLPGADMRSDGVRFYFSSGTEQALHAAKLAKTGGLQ
jgi:hypothetical protein